MTTNVLFLCPHGAAKSTTAAAYLEREGLRRGLDLVIDNAGTDPDPVVNPTVAVRLAAQDLPPGRDPRRVSEDDLNNADVIVNIGCDIPALVGDGRVLDWSIPNFSVDAEVAFASIETAVDALVGKLVTQRAPESGDD